MEKKSTYSIAMTNAQPMMSSSCSHCNAAVAFSFSAVQIRRQNWSYEIYSWIMALGWKEGGESGNIQNSSIPRKTHPFPRRRTWRFRQLGFRGFQRHGGPVHRRRRRLAIETGCQFVPISRISEQGPYNTDPGRVPDWNGSKASMSVCLGRL